MQGARKGTLEENIQTQVSSYTWTHVTVRAQEAQAADLW